MIIDLQRTVIRMQLRRFVVLIIFVLLILASMFMLSLQQRYFGMTKYQVALIFGLIYLLIMSVEAMFELYYIYFSDEGDLIIFRYFSTGYFNRKKQVIQIPKKSFSGYEITDSILGLKKKITLKQRLKTSVVQYPPVSITLLNEKQRTQLTETLDKYKDI